MKPTENVKEELAEAAVSVLNGEKVAADSYEYFFGEGRTDGPV